MGALALGEVKGLQHPETVVGTFAEHRQTSRAPWPWAGAASEPSLHLPGKHHPRQGRALSRGPGGAQCRPG